MESHNSNESKMPTANVSRKKSFRLFFLVQVSKNPTVGREIFSHRQNFLENIIREKNVFLFQNLVNRYIKIYSPNARFLLDVLLKNIIENIKFPCAL